MKNAGDEIKFQNQDDIRVFLRARLEDHRVKNSAFSLRAFSRSLQLSPASLSQIISGKRSITYRTAKKISDQLGLTPLEERALLAAIDGGQSPDPSALPKKAFQLEVDKFKIVADWYHFAILSLTEVEKSKPNAVWISKRLGITPAVAKDAMARLVRMGLLEIKGTKWKQSTSPISVASGTSSSAIQKFHRQILERAAQSLEKDAVTDREFGAVTMAVNPDQIPKAKQMIQDFRKNLSQFLEQGPQTRVFTLAVQLFPIDTSDSVPQETKR